MADFVYSKQIGIIIVTNKVIFSLDLEIIKKYIKNVNYIDMDNVNVPQLP